MNGLLTRKQVNRAMMQIRSGVVNAAKEAQQRRDPVRLPIEPQPGFAGAPLARPTFAHYLEDRAREMIGSEWSWRVNPIHGGDADLIITGYNP